MLKTVKSAMKRMDASITNFTNSTIAARNLAQTGSAYNRFSDYMAKSTTGKSVPVGRPNRHTYSSVMRSVDVGLGKGRQKLARMASVVTSPAMGRGVTAGAAIVGAAGMTAVSMMSGMMSKAQDIMAERYMRDSRYSSRMMTQTSIGQSSGQSTLNIGNHAGLGLALYRGRHG